jgi:dTDP-4-amino-4,6-dideoxygalactose transaminase
MSYVPAWPVLGPGQLLGAPASRATLPFPLGQPDARRFYVARNAIYQLFRALGGGTVLVPSYHHGNEVRAIRAAGARVRFYPVDRQMRPDLEAVDRLCQPGVTALFAIHYLGFPQPLEILAPLCQERGVPLVEDCALALLSESAGRPLGSVGEFGVFCLYKTLPVPNGGVLVCREGSPQGLRELTLRRCDGASLAGRGAELLLGGVRLRWERVGGALMALKRATGRGLTAAGVSRVPVGDEGFDVAQADLGISPLSEAILRRCDYATIRTRRRRNYARLLECLRGETALVLDDLADGTCPLFFPLLVRDKEAAAAGLASAGIETVPFWNNGDPEAEGGAAFADTLFLRRHVLEIPIHQDVALHQVERIAKRILELRMGLAA